MRARYFGWLLGLAVSAIVPGCGSGGDGTPPPPSTEQQVELDRMKADLIKVAHQKGARNSPTDRMRDQLLRQVRRQ